MIKNITGPWKFSTAHDDKSISVSVPGSALDHLLKSNRIKDPFWGTNEKTALEALDQDFIYEVDITLTSQDLEQGHLDLYCEGLDTLCEVYFNDQWLGFTNNMFRPYAFSILDQAQLGLNRLKFLFKNAQEYLKAQQKKEFLWNPEHTLSGLGHIRKAHYMSGWDWGPKLPDAGLFKSVSIRSWRDSLYKGIKIYQDHNKDGVTLSFEAQFEGALPSELEWSFLDPESNLIKTWTSTSSKTELVLESPRLWWPRGMGEQPLYQLQLVYSDGSESQEVTQIIGLRTLTVTQEEDEWGRSFALTVNGIPFFAKGANYIPEDNFLTRITKEKTEALLEECLWANFNLIRVWGGGYYLDDYFYDYCDKTGLVVWQDFMFACSTYPTREDFKETVREEIQYTVRRLRNHPSIALYCGNNELETAHVDWGFDASQENKNNYLELFENMIPSVLKEEDPHRFYWPSSPSSGGGFDKPNDHNHGDVHDWRVWHGEEPISYFRDKYHRFLSEFGMQSFPVWSTIESFTEPSDRELLSEVMKNHQKNEAGNQKIAHYIRESFGNTKSDFKTLVYASQAVQAEAITEAAIHLRQHRGRCMGVIYWQLNDCWPGASWSSIDYYHRRKMLHYQIKEAYAPVVITSRREQDKIILYLVNDTNREIQGDFYYTLKNQDFEVKEGDSKSAMCPAYSVINWEVPLPKGTDISRDFMDYHFQTRQGQLWEGFSLFCDRKEYNFVSAKVRISSLKDNSLTLIADKFTPLVWIDSSQDLKWDRNAFPMTRREISINLESFPEPVDREKLQVMTPDEWQI
ncbi:glycoside hydrolase family 2 protein [Spirochaeta cellobiosiphila]|uniref:glycoside hydrolase family 2 protein n=1 Tax=Spirochaeta cellobiosiphila TaxID=504483 RepID=UPI0004095D5C|nr:glycoside hydrolase family 2 protein [Spirochaeta cellobiosiphila]